MQPVRSKFVPVAVLLLSVVLAAAVVVMSWRHYPMATSAAFFLFVVGGAFAVRHPRNKVGYSVTLGAVIGVFVGGAVVLIQATHAT